MDTKSNTLSNGWTVFILFVLIVIMVFAGMFVPGGFNWLIVAFSMFVFMIVLGLRITGRAMGILINERKLMSLSRFQMVIWTIIILSAYFTIAMVRIRAGTSNPLEISMDWHLWALIGISTTSLIGTPLIQSTKKLKEPRDEKVLEETANKFGESAAKVNEDREGVLYGNGDIMDAKFTDIFEGDELKNTAYIDLTKVQMFFFTLIAALSYAVILFCWIKATKEPARLDMLPKLHDGLIAILGISHTGYLTNKGISYTAVKE
jgi:hypothetical protein